MAAREAFLVAARATCSVAATEDFCMAAVTPTRLYRPQPGLAPTRPYQLRPSDHHPTAPVSPPPPPRHPRQTSHLGDPSWFPGTNWNF